jgi:hypothetical protein
MAVLGCVWSYLHLELASTTALVEGNLGAADN